MNPFSEKYETIGPAMSQQSALNQKEHNEFWKTRRKAMHPLNFLWLILGEAVIFLFFGGNGDTNGIAGTIAFISFMAIIIQIPWSIVSLIIWKIFIKRKLPVGTKIKKAIHLRKTGNEEKNAIESVRSNTSQELTDTNTSTSKNNIYTGTRAQARRHSKHAAPKVSLPKPTFSLLAQYSSSKIENYGAPLDSRSDELDRLMVLDPKI